MRVKQEIFTVRANYYNTKYIKMRKLIRTVAFILLIAIEFVSCDKSNDTFSELRLSVDAYEVYTDGIEYSFDIISGAGGYEAEIVLVNEYDEYATVTVSDNKVNVQLVGAGTQIKITDKSGQEKQLIIWSTNEALQITNHSIGVGYGLVYESKLNFGSGEGYSILKCFNDRVVDFELKENGEFVLKTRAPGQAGYVIRDSRGTTNYMKIGVYDGRDLDWNEVEVNIKVGSQFTFPIKWGEGDVRVLDCSPELKNYWLLIKEKDEIQEYDVLQVCANEGSTGKLFMELIDSLGNIARITLNVTG